MRPQVTRSRREDAGEVVDSRPANLDVEVVVGGGAGAPVDPPDHGDIRVDDEQLDVVDHA